MSFYKILEEVKEIIRFQLIQRSYQKLELRLITNQRKVAFEKAQKELLDFLKNKNIFNVEIFLSDELPQANKVSGKYNHIYKNFEKKLKHYH